MPEYHVHQGIITVSEELERHLNNQMREGQERKMVLHEVDSTTFERFLQWAYSGDCKLSVIFQTLYLHSGLKLTNFEFSAYIALVVLDTSITSISIFAYTPLRNVLIFPNLKMI